MKTFDRLVVRLEIYKKGIWVYALRDNFLEKKEETESIEILWQLVRWGEDDWRSKKYYYIKGFQPLFVTRKPEVSSMVITDPRHVLRLTDERLAEEL